MSTRRRVELGLAAYDEASSWIDEKHFHRDVPLLLDLLVSTGLFRRISSSTPIDLFFLAILCKAL